MAADAQSPTAPGDVYCEFENHGIELDEFLARMYTYSKAESDDYVQYMTRCANSDERQGDYIALMEDESKSTGCRVMAFYALCIFYRRRWEYTKFREAVNRGEQLFFGEPLVRVQKMVCLKTCPKDKKRDYAAALAIWNSLDSRMKTQPAFMLAYADTVALCFENGLMDASKEGDEASRIEVMSEIAQAMALHCSPKFYAVSARLHAVGGEYDRALEDIMCAIDEEDSSIDDYELRMIEYRSILNRIEADKRNAAERKKLESSMEEIARIREEVEKSKYDNLAFLGFFAALLAFVSGSFSVAQAVDSTSQLAQLVLVIAGAMVIAFSAFSLLLPKASKAATFAMLALGVLVVVCSLAFVSA